MHSNLPCRSKQFNYTSTDCNCQVKYEVIFFTIRCKKFTTRDQPVSSIRKPVNAGEPRIKSERKSRFFFDKNVSVCATLDYTSSKLEDKQYEEENLTEKIQN